MQKKDYCNIGILICIVTLIFYPIFYTHYFYTDEVLQLWNYRKGAGFHMFLPQGRWLTDRLFMALFSSIGRIDQLTRLRLFSLAAWLLCIPAWYYVFVRVCRREGLPGLLPFFSVLYLITSMPFSVSVQWASCMELSLANTAGLVAGYCVYASLGNEGDKIKLSAGALVAGLILGLVALFFYQNGFGAFLLPFFLRFIARQKADRRVALAVGFYFFVYIIYFLLFKMQMRYMVAGVSERTSLATDPFAKMSYFLAKVLPGAFYFNLAINDHTVIAGIVVVLAGIGCLLGNFSDVPVSFRPVIRRLGYGAWLFGAFVLIYLPSLVVRENYASNRTMLALDMAVFIWVSSTLLRRIDISAWQRIVVAVTGILLVAGSWYNFRCLFLRPAVHEYAVMKSFIDKNYSPGVSSVDFIRSAEDQVRTRNGVQSSWDEFGLSSAYFEWVPEALVKQLVFEKTGDRSMAGRLVVRNWPDEQAWRSSGGRHPAGSLWIDAAVILR